MVEEVRSMSNHVCDCSVDDKLLKTINGNITEIRSSVFSRDVSPPATAI